eukprot:PRCOL_00006600-RA
METQPHANAPGAPQAVLLVGCCEWEAAAAAGGAAATAANPPAGGAGAGAAAVDSLVTLALSRGAPALLPVGNVPLLEYSLRMLAKVRTSSVLVLVAGEAAAKSVSAYVSERARTDKDKQQVEVIAMPEECGSAEALRRVGGKLHAGEVIVVGGDVVTGVSLREVLAMHRERGAALSSMYAPARSKSNDPKAKRSPADLVGVLSGRGSGGGATQLLFSAPGPRSGGGDGALRLRRAVARAAGSMRIRTDLFDAHVHVLSRDALAVLESRPAIRSIREDLVPLLTRHQIDDGFPESLVLPLTDVDAADAGAAEDGGAKGGKSGADGADGGADVGVEDAAAMQESPSPSPALSRQDSAADVTRKAAKDSMAHLRDQLQQIGGRRAVGGCWAYIVTAAGASEDAEAQAGTYCAVVGSYEAYLEANRDLAGPAVGLTGHEVTARDNVLHPSVRLGQRCTVGAACIVGEGCVLGDKTSVKRSVIGANCKLGNGVKIINAVLHDGVNVGDGVTIQGSVVANDAHLMEKAVIKECQVGEGFVAASGIEYKGELLAKRDVVARRPSAMSNAE